jgi:hypothetical protein
VRTAGTAEAALPALRQAIRALEPEVAFTEDVAATDVAETTMAPTRIAALLVGAFGGLALVLAAVGLYGVGTFDPLACGGAAAVLLVVATAANLVPAIQAARIDPMRALRNE